MPKKWTLAESFAHFGAVGNNPRWSWSARSPDGKTVVITLWEDRLIYSAGIVTYDEAEREKLPGWTERPGNRERLENLAWARDNCTGVFRVVITKAKDVNVSPREIADCHPQPKLIMRITALDRQTGAFTARSL
jgi:hypothetical protein